MRWRSISFGHAACWVLANIAFRYSSKARRDARDWFIRAPSPAVSSLLVAAWQLIHRTITSALCAMERTPSSWLPHQWPPGPLVFVVRRNLAHRSLVCVALALPFSFGGDAAPRILFRHRGAGSKTSLLTPAKRECCFHLFNGVGCCLARRLTALLFGRCGKPGREREWLCVARQNIRFSRLDPRTECWNKVEPGITPRGWVGVSRR